MKDLNRCSSLLAGLVLGISVVAACGDDDLKKSNNAPNNVSNNATNNSTNNSTIFVTNNGTNNSTNNDTTGPVPNYVILITDLTTGDACNGNDPGSDIISVSLEDAQARVLGYGALKYDGITGDTNEYNFGDNLNGSPPFGDFCPEFDPFNVTALGCGGSIGLMFLDFDGNIVAIEQGMQIRVSEYGQECGGSNDDQFEVFICTNTNDVVTNDVLTSCTQKIGGGSGEVTLLVL